MKNRFLVLLICLTLLLSFSAHASELTLGEVNEFLNHSAKIGEGSKANQVAVIPFDHVDGPGDEDLFYAFVPFKYVARNYIKYQVCFLSCTCRSADLNLWSTAYVELSLPDSGKIDDAEVRALSFDTEPSGHYVGGLWGDSNPGPGGQTYEKFKAEWVPYYIGKTYADIKVPGTIKDIAQDDFAAGEGRAEMTVDAWSGATVSGNNTLRMLQALYRYHATDMFFDADPDAAALRDVFEVEREAAAPVAAAAVAAVDGELPAPVDTSKTYKADKDDAEEIPCEEGNFGPTCSAITSDNLLQYLGRTDVAYIDLRDYNDYAKKHLKNFEVIPFLSLIYNENAIVDPSLPQLYGGDVNDPTPVYAESDEILSALFPKNKTLFIMCQGGGRAANMLRILKARGWDMSKVYNIGGMAHYVGPEYRAFVTDTPEILVEATYRFDGLTRIAPAEGAEIPDIRTAKAAGFGGGDVIVKATFDDEAKIAALEIDATSQTEGLGQNAMQEGFISQFIGRSLPVSAEEIDAIAGATLTTSAVLEALNSMAE